MAGSGNTAKKRKVFWMLGSQVTGKKVAQPKTKRMARRGIAGELDVVVIQPKRGK